MTKIKICGLRRLEDVHMVNRFQPDACGFILSRPFRRYVPEDQLKLMKAELDPGITAFGVFVNEPYETVCRYLQNGLIDAVQLHGDEDENYIRRLKTDYPDVCVMKAFTVREKADAEKADACPADLVLLDSGRGSGKTFDWGLLESVARPYVLAGGLNPENITEALRKLDPYGVDTSSGVETDGCKDSEKIRRLIEAVRQGE